MSLPSQVDIPGVRENFEALGEVIHWGFGDPNGRVRAGLGALYLNKSGGAGNTLWVKESGANTANGWVAK